MIKSAHIGSHLSILDPEFCILLWGEDQRASREEMSPDIWVALNRFNTLRPNSADHSAVLGTRKKFVPGGSWSIEVGSTGHGWFRGIISVVSDIIVGGCD